jgi:hypothetical protein
MKNIKIKFLLATIKSIKIVKILPVTLFRNCSSFYSHLSFQKLFLKPALILKIVPEITDFLKFFKPSKNW